MQWQKQRWINKMRNYRLGLMLGLVLSAPMLTACGQYGASPPPSQIRLATLPSDLRSCFTQLVGPPPAGDLSTKQVADLMVKLRHSEIRMSNCGKRMVAWYDTQARVFGR